MVGWVRLRARGPAGTTITVRHAEILAPDGGLYLDNIRGALQTNHYTLSGQGEEDLRAALHLAGLSVRGDHWLPWSAQPGRRDRRGGALGPESYRHF